MRSGWDPTTPRGAVVFFHGNNRGTAEELRQPWYQHVDTALDLGMALIVPASPNSLPEELSFGERTLLPEAVGAGGTRFRQGEDARLVHELLQNNLKSRLALEHDRIVFARGSQGTCFLARFMEFYGSSYGGGLHAHCGCFWLDFDGNDSHDTYAVAPPFHHAPWRPSFQWTPSAAESVGERFRVFVEATTGDFLHEAAQSMAKYYSDWLGLETRVDLDAPGGHCSSGDTPLREIFEWLSSGAAPARPGTANDTDGDGTPNRTDLDDDGDGAPDFIDTLPLDYRDWRDTDGDGIADALDRDADGDGVSNAADAFPLNPREQRDTDGDGIGDRMGRNTDGRGLAFVSKNDRLSGYTGGHIARRVRVHASRPSDVVYPAVRGDSASYQFLELGDAGGRSNGLEYGPSSVWRGEVEMPSGGRLLALAVDGNGDGRFDIPSDALLEHDKDFVCLDRDGWLNECDFTEDADGNRTRPGALLPDRPFTWRGNRYELAVAPSGHNIRVAREDGSQPPQPDPDTTRALRFDGGYDVSMCCRTPDGDEGQARSGVWASGQSGILWFFDRGNAEVLVKVLDGCKHNGHRWAFVASVTTLEFNLWITGPDGTRWTHSNRQGQTASTRSDTTAFQCAHEDST